MKTLQPSITDADFQAYNMEGAKEIDFRDLLLAVQRESIRKALRECHEIARNTGLSEMTAEEIDAEMRQR
jgi:hypothetical protein